MGGVGGVGGAGLVVLVLAAAAVGGSEGSWCVCTSGTNDSALQSALDYACGDGGADCTAIQSDGVCFLPDTLLQHCSYAVNSYYQSKGQDGGTCDFSGAASTVDSDPSPSTACTYPSTATPSSATGNSTNTTPPSSATNGSLTPPTTFNLGPAGSTVGGFSHAHHLLPTPPELFVYSIVLAAAALVFTTPGP